MEITYTFNSDCIPAKLNPQQKQLVEATKDLGTCKKETILAKLEGNLTTKQDHWLIFKYYQPEFIKSGFVVLDKKNKEPEVKVKKERARGEVKTIVVETLGGEAFPQEQVETQEELASQGF